MTRTHETRLSAKALHRLVSRVQTALPREETDDVSYGVGDTLRCVDEALAGAKTAVVLYITQISYLEDSDGDEIALLSVTPSPSVIVSCMTAMGLVLLPIHPSLAQDKLQAAYYLQRPVSRIQELPPFYTRSNQTCLVVTWEGARLETVVEQDAWGTWVPAKPEASE